MINKILKHLINWLELYLWFPLSIIGIQASAYAYYFFTGRAIVDDPWGWVVGFAPILVKCILAIALTSIFVQQTGTWFTPEQQAANPILSSVKNITKCVTLITFLYFLSH